MARQINYFYMMSFRVRTYTDNTGSTLNPSYLENLLLRNGRLGYIKTLITWLMTLFFHKTCTIGLYTYSANDPYHKQRIDKISRTVPLLIAGHIFCYSFLRMIFTGYVLLLIFIECYPQLWMVIIGYRYSY